MLVQSGLQALGVFLEGIRWVSRIMRSEHSTALRVWKWIHPDVKQDLHHVIHTIKQGQRSQARFRGPYQGALLKVLHLNLVCLVPFIALHIFLQVETPKLNLYSTCMTEGHCIQH
jgi:hypothetical protein